MITFQEFRENLVEFKIQKSAVAKSPTQRRMERRKKMLGGGRQKEKLAIRKWKRSAAGKRAMEPGRIKRMKRIGKTGLGKPMRVNITKGKSAQAAVMSKRKAVRKQLTSKPKRTTRKSIRKN